MATANKTPNESVKDSMSSVTELIARAKKEGSIQAADLSAALEKLDLSPEQIEKIYDTFDAMGIQITGAELNLDPDSDLDISLDNIEEEELVDIDEVKQNIAAIEAELAQVQAQMAKYLEELGL